MLMCVLWWIYGQSLIRPSSFSPGLLSLAGPCSPNEFWSDRFTVLTVAVWEVDGIPERALSYQGISVMAFSISGLSEWRLPVLCFCCGNFSLVSKPFRQIWIGLVIPSLWGSDVWKLPNVNVLSVVTACAVQGFSLTLSLLQRRSNSATSARKLCMF